MAAEHILSLEIPLVANKKILTISDTSSYSDAIGINDPEILILAPGFSTPALINMNPNFNVNFDACDLGLQTQNCEEKQDDLPDGIYVVRYRVQPHDKVYVEYNHLRVTDILSKYFDKLCQLDITPCEPTSDKKFMISELKYVRTMIDAAIAKVEYCHSPSEGMNLYNFALKKLNKITCDSCCS